MPTMTNNTVNISQLMEKICRKLKPVCTAMVAKRTFFLPNLWSIAQHKTWYMQVTAALPLWVRDKRCWV